MIGEENETFFIRMSKTSGEARKGKPNEENIF